MRMRKNVFFLIVFCGAFSVNHSSAQVSEKVIATFLNDTAVRTGHAGISIYDPATGKYLYRYNADKNFTPSSNVKLFTLYAGMKYLKDSVPGLVYLQYDSILSIVPAGDPTFLHPDFQSQPVLDFLNTTKNKIYLSDETTSRIFRESRYGSGWSWDDYQEDFMAERSLFPVYGNTFSFTKEHSTGAVPVNSKLRMLATSGTFKFGAKTNNRFARDFYSNNFFIGGFGKVTDYKVPFITSVDMSAGLLSDTLHKNIYRDSLPVTEGKLKAGVIYSRPVDSLFRPMMFNSDNFFAEQTLLMVSNEKFGYMNDETIIDSLLAKDFKDIPTKPRWVDGSGLSRYNLFSPDDFVYILNKIRSEFGWQRIKNILPGAGQGTLTNYYENAAGYIYAKTGSMSNNVSLSGYLITKKNKTLLFSVIINNFDGTGRSGRRAIEKLVQAVRESN